MKISYGRYLVSPSGSVYTQRILVNEREYETLADSILCEIEMGYPQKNIYTFGSSKEDCKVRFKNLEVVKVKENHFDKKYINVAFLKIPHVLYLSKFKELKSRLKTNQNTYIQII